MVIIQERAKIIIHLNEYYFQLNMRRDFQIIVLVLLYAFLVSCNGAKKNSINSKNSVLETNEESLTEDKNEEYMREVKQFRDNKLRIIKGVLEDFDEDFYPVYEWNDILNAYNYCVDKINSTNDLFSIDIYASAILDYFDAKIAICQHFTPYKAFSHGNGSQDNPYVINTLENLNWLAKETYYGNSNGNYYSLENDIYICGNLAQIGSSFNGNSFKGYFNGNGHIIKNIVFDQKFYNNIRFSDKKYMGLFGVNDGLIENVGVVDLNIDLYVNGDFIFAGGICGKNNGTIRNCYAIGDIKIEYNETGIYDYNKSYDIGAGGITCINENYGIIKDSYSLMNITIIHHGIGDIIVSGIGSYGKTYNCLAINSINITVDNNYDDFCEIYEISRDFNNLLFL